MTAQNTTLLASLVRFEFTFDSNSISSGVRNMNIPKKSAIRYAALGKYGIPIKIAGIHNNVI